MKILNFGSCNIDYVYSLEHIVVPGETLSASKREVFPGGKGLNQSVAVARAGAQVFHAGVIGNDGAMLRAVLEESGADTRYLETADQPNGHAVIQLASNAQNSIFLYEGTNGMITEQMVDRVLENFGTGDILLLQNEEECYEFFQDLCTVSELRSMEQRFEVAALLEEGMIYNDILERTGASSATISRVNRSLSYGTGGYGKVFERLKEEKE